MEVNSSIIPDNSDPQNSIMAWKAGIFRRGLAFLADHLIVLLILLFVFNYYFDFFLYKIIFSSWEFALTVTIVILIIELYFILFELLWSGKTPGKWLMGIYVTEDKGGNPGFFPVLIRNLLRCTYFIPPLFVLPDIVCIIIDKNNKRLGDLAAGTIVIVNKKRKKPGMPSGVREIGNSGYSAADANPDEKN